MPHLCATPLPQRVLSTPFLYPVPGGLRLPRVPGSIPKTWILHQQLPKAKLKPSRGGLTMTFCPLPAPNPLHIQPPQERRRGERGTAAVTGGTLRAWGLAAAPGAPPVIIGPEC